MVSPPCRTSRATRFPIVGRRRLGECKVGLLPAGTLACVWGRDRASPFCRSSPLLADNNVTIITAHEQTAGYPRCRSSTVRSRQSRAFSEPHGTFSGRTLCYPLIHPSRMPEWCRSALILQCLQCANTLAHSQPRGLAATWMLIRRASSITTLKLFWNFDGAAGCPGSRISQPDLWTIVEPIRRNQSDCCKVLQIAEQGSLKTFFYECRSKAADMRLQKRCGFTLEVLNSKAPEARRVSGGILFGLASSRGVRQVSETTLSYLRSYFAAC